MLTSLVGIIFLVGVLFVSILDRGDAQIRFLDWHAAVVVIGGVIGCLLIALRWSTCSKMLSSWFSLFTGRDFEREEIEELKREIASIESAWSEGRRSDVLGWVEEAKTLEARIAAEALVQQLQGQRLAERFERLRSTAETSLLPQVEGWDMVARLAPSFGIVGTVAGMVQLFRHMANSSGNLGGAMAMALLATLYGILLGTAVGGPMSTRLNQRLAERLGLIELLERKVAALLEEDRLKFRGTAGALEVRA